MLTRRRIQLVCLGLLVASLAWHGWDLSPEGLLDRTGRLKCPDFLQFYTYGTLLRTGQAASLYDPDAHARIARMYVDPRMTLGLFRPNYSPAVAWLVAPLSNLPYLRAMTAWLLASSLLYGLGVALLLPVLPWLRRETRTVWGLAAAWPAFFMVLRYGQLSALSFALVALATRLAMSGRDVAAGVALGLLVYKPNLLVAPALILAFAGQWRLLAGVVAGAFAETLGAIATVGPGVFREYVDVLAFIAQHPESVQLYPAESHSFGSAFRLWSAPPSVVMAATIAGLVGAAWAGVRVWRTMKDPRPRWAALVLASLIASPHLLTYDLLLLAVPLLLLADWIGGETGRVPAGAWLTLLVLLYAGAWPGTLLARIYAVQCSTIGMGLGLWLLAQASRSRRGLATGASSSMSPIISS